MSKSNSNGNSKDIICTVIPLGCHLLLNSVVLSGPAHLPQFSTCRGDGVDDEREGIMGTTVGWFGETVGDQVLKQRVLFSTQAYDMHDIYGIEAPQSAVHEVVEQIGDTVEGKSTYCYTEVPGSIPCRDI